MEAKKRDRSSQPKAFAPLHDQSGLAEVSRALRAAAAQQQPAQRQRDAPAVAAPAVQAFRPPQGAAASPATTRNDEVACAAAPVASELAAAQPPPAPLAAVTDAPPRRTFRDFYTDAYLSAFGEELSSLEDGSADVGLLLAAIRQGADTFSAEHQTLALASEGAAAEPMT